MQRFLLFVVSGMVLLSVISTMLPFAGAAEAAVLTSGR